MILSPKISKSVDFSSKMFPQVLRNSSVTHGNSKAMVLFIDPSEDEINFDTFVRFSLSIFRFVFFDFKPLNENASLLHKFIFNLKRNYIKLSIFGIHLAPTLIAIYVFTSTDDLLKASTSTLDSLTGFVTAIKFLITFAKKDELLEIMQELRMVFNLHVNRNKDYEVKKYLNEYHFYIRILALTVFLALTQVAFPVIPFLINGTMENSIKYWFPFDTCTPSTFPISLVWADWVAWTLFLSSLASDALLYACISVIAMEFNILRVDLKNLSSTQSHKRIKTLGVLTDRHNKLLELSEKLQGIYSVSFLLSFGGSSVIMCVVVFQLSVGKMDLAAYIFYLAYLALMGGQILYLCSFGQKLINASESVAEGVYTSEWESFEEEDLKKQLVLTILRAQKAKRLSAMNFAEISLVSYTTVSLMINLNIN